MEFLNLVCIPLVIPIYYLLFKIQGRLTRVETLLNGKK